MKVNGWSSNQPTNRPTRSMVDLPKSGHHCCSLWLYAVLRTSESLVFFSHKLLKHKFRVLLEGHTFAVVTCSPMIEHLLMRPYWETRHDDQEWQYCTKGSAKKSWKLVSVTLKGERLIWRVLLTCNNYNYLPCSEYKDRKATVKLRCDEKKRKKDEAVFEISCEDKWVRAP